MITARDYALRRAELAATPDRIEEVERRYQSVLVDMLLAEASTMKDELDAAAELRPFWINYAMEQRGRGAIGDSCPYLDLAEKTTLPRVFKAFDTALVEVSLAGIPAGSDLRFVTEDAYLHVDSKATGPRDNPDEIVVPPYQVSGDGVEWANGGMRNSVVQVVGPRAEMEFHPNLPPFYVIDNRTLVTVTLFLKVVYGVTDFGDQPLEYFEAVCVPNGLLMFDGPRYASAPGLLIPGKDDKGKNPLKFRTRVRLQPLAELAEWRCVKVARTAGGEWKATPRKAV